MGVNKNEQVTERFKQKANAFRQGLSQAMPLLGEIVRDEIVHTTLAGIGAGDKPLAPYSAGYQALIDSVGGKPGGVVDLRGIFDKGKGKKTRTFKDRKAEARRQRNALAKGIGRRAFVQVSFGAVSFVAKTKPTRPREMEVDPNSEMSADLIKVIPNPTGFKLQYRPREVAYMIGHNNGTIPHTPKREWFSVDKTPVRAALASGLSNVFRAMIQNFNGK